MKSRRISHLLLAVVAIVVSIPLSPVRVFPTIPPSEVEITELIVFGAQSGVRSDSNIRHHFDSPERVVIAFKEDFFLIRFAVPGSEEPTRFHYAYRLQGLEDAWIPIGTKDSVILEDLKPGSYVFFVRASLDGESWPDTQDRLEIVIIPAFWQTPVFYGIVAAVVLLLLVLFIRFVRKRGRVRLEIDVDLPRLAEKFQLTERETETLERVLKGDNNEEIGKKLYISESTVQKHIYSIYRKLNVKNRLQLLYVVQRADRSSRLH